MILCHLPDRGGLHLFPGWLPDRLQDPEAAVALDFARILLSDAECGVGPGKERPSVPPEAVPPRAQPHAAVRALDEVGRRQSPHQRGRPAQPFTVSRFNLRTRNTYRGESQEPKAFSLAVKFGYCQFLLIPVLFSRWACRTQIVSPVTGSTYS